MDKSLPIILIQNTNYHFETLISVYQILKNLGYNPHIYRYLPDKFNQLEFIQYYGMNIATQPVIDSAYCAFVISAYPNPHVTKDTCIPNDDNIIFSKFKNRLIYISHRFMKEEDYNEDGLINRNNALCLSPLSSKIGIDYIYLTDTPITPVNNPLNKLKLTIQAHFGLQNRSYQLLYKMIRLYRGYTNTNIKYNIIGTETHQVLPKIMDKIPQLNISRYEGMDELDFYNILNTKTNWIICGIQPLDKRGSYLCERYSSNFNHALALEKPIICHESFKNIYEIPGYYYSDTHDVEYLSNSTGIIDDISKINNTEYMNMIDSFKNLKQKFTLHNQKILHSKIEYISEHQYV